MTPIEERLARGEKITFHEAIYDCCMHGTLTEEMAREWLDGDDLTLALRIIHSGVFMERALPVVPETGGEDAGPLDGATRIALERKLQIEDRGWTPDHDDAHIAVKGHERYQRERQT